MIANLAQAFLIAVKKGVRARPLLAHKKIPVLIFFGVLSLEGAIAQSEDSVLMAIDELRGVAVFSMENHPVPRRVGDALDEKVVLKKIYAEGVDIEYQKDESGRMEMFFLKEGQDLRLVIEMVRDGMDQFHYVMESIPVEDEK